MWYNPRRDRLENEKEDKVVRDSTNHMVTSYQLSPEIYFLTLSQGCAIMNYREKRERVFDKAGFRRA